MPNAGTADLEELLCRWEEMRDRGETVSIEMLCRACPERIEQLREHIRKLEAMDAVLDCRAEEAGAEAALPAIPGYEILGEVGRGGMGIVYRARQLMPDRPAAVKMLIGGRRPSEVELARFRRETAALAGLRHPNLITVYEVGDAAGRPFCAMEYIGGGSLAQWTRGRPQPPRQAAELVRTLAEAMQVVHAHGIVHRDLKPSNILFDSPEIGAQAVSGETDRGSGDWPRGATPKISDFGLARRFDDAGGLTLSGEILGSPSYMAPEQARGELQRLGPATDVYGLGVILYELLPGRPPVQADTPWNTLRRVLTDEPVSPSSVIARVPRDLQTICLKCLEKDPARRYVSAALLAEDLRRFLANEPISARPIGWIGRGVKWAWRHPTAAGVFSVFFAACVAFALSGHFHAVSLARALRETQLRAEESRDRLVRLFVDRGTRLLDEGDWFRSLPWFVEALRLDAGGGEAENVHRTRIASTLRQCPRLVKLWFHEGAVSRVRFAPDGRMLAGASADGLVIVQGCESAGSAAMSLPHPRAVADFDFSPDGKRIATACEDGRARVWSASTGRLLLPPLEHSGPVRCIAFHPNGKTVASAGDDGLLRLWNVSDGRLQGPAMPHGAPIRGMALNRAGDRIATAGENGEARLWNVDAGVMAAPALKHNGAVFHVAFSPDGDKIATAGADRTACVWNARTGERIRVFRHRLDVLCAVFSPDGRFLATAGDDPVACLWNLADDGRIASILPHCSSINVVKFSPDGRWLVTGADDNAARLWTPADGEMIPPFLSHHGSIRDVAIRSDGRWIATAGNDHAVRVWEVNEPTPSAANDLESATAAGRPDGTWRSPDGRLNAVLKSDLVVQVCDAIAGKPLGPPLNHSSAVVYAAFSRDGRRLVVAGDNNRAYLWDWAAGELSAAPLRHQGTVRYVAFSDDGRRIVTVCDDHSVRAWDAAAGEPLMPQWRCLHRIIRAAFSPDGDRLTIYFADAPPHRINLLPDERSVEQLETTAELLSGGVIHVSRGFLPDAPERLQAIWAKITPPVP